MAGFTDLVAQAQPALIGQGCAASGTAGRTWSWRFTDLVDNDGDPIDLSAITGTAAVVTAPGGSDVVELTFDGGIGEFTIGADEGDTAGTFSGADYQRGRSCYWYLTLDDGTDSVQAWLVDNSPFQIRKGV